MNKLYSFLLILTGMLAVQLAAPSNVGATVNLNPNPGSSIPYVQHNLLSNCDTLFKTSPAYAYFFTYAGNSSVDIGSFEVGPSNPSVNIRMNWASSVCKPNSAVNLTTLQAVPTTPGVFGLAPGMAHDHTSTAGAGNYNIPGTYRHSFGEFSYSPPGGFTASGSYTVNIDLYRISRFQSGTILCVNAGSRNPANVLDFSACGKLTLTATFWVNVHNNPAPSLNVVSTCTGIDVATSGTRADIYGPSGGLGNVIGKSGSFKLEGLVSAGTTVDVYGIGDGSTTFGNTHAAHTWIPPSDCRSNFSIRPTASVNLNDTENPTSANFFSVARLDSGPASVNNVSVRHYYFVIKDGLEVSLSDNSTTESITPSGATYRQDGVNVSILGLKAGDQVCSSVYVNPGGGVAKLDGTIISKNPEEVSDKQCQTIVNKPFISFYGGDVAVGGDFANVASCDSPSSGVGITASLNSSNLGAGVEFAAMATGSIQGFRTAKATPTAPINKLGFANTSSHFGNFGSATCIKDYFASFTSISPSNMTDITSDTSIDIDTKSSGSYGYNVSSGHTLSLKGTLDLSQRVALYINGDLVIDNEISADSSWTTIEQIPSLHVYVKGNIYIQPNVKEMTGLFVAQPSSPTDTDGGKIITCSNGKSAVANNAIYNTCNNKLLVKGSLVAKKIDFLRAKGSLRDANIKGEQDASTSAAAEVIELTPEILMVAPDDITNANASRYQYFTVLPPVL